MSAPTTLLQANTSPIRDGEFLASLDLGSNSFHMMVARYTLGQLRTVDRIREMVRLADGLNGDGSLHPDVLARALECLQRFGQRLQEIPPQRVRAVATNTVRALEQPQSFLVPAEAALGHAIEVVSGREEARLVYLGVAHAQPPKPGRLRLVVDIGGGSTECIIGNGYDPLERESLQMGCVATTRRYFDDGKLNRKRWNRARDSLQAEFQRFAHTYRDLGWDEALGSSGTIKAIGKVCAGLKLTKGGITAEALPHVREHVLEAGRISAIDLPGLSEERKPVIAGGILILEAAFEVLQLQRMTPSRAALREGVLVDMLGRGGADDPRAASVAALMQRYGIDHTQAQRVERTAQQMFDQVAADWQLDEDTRWMLAWASRLHETGLMIAHNQYHVHGAYVLEHSDIAGFSRQEQAMLAALVRSHRRTVARGTFAAIPDRLLAQTRRSAALLRLAVLLHRSHDSQPQPPVTIHADGDILHLKLPPRWLDARPLLRADLKAEPPGMAGLGIQLIVD